MVNVRAWELGSPAFIPSCVSDLLGDFSVPQFYYNNGVSFPFARSARKIPGLFAASVKDEVAPHLPRAD